MRSPAGKLALALLATLAGVALSAVPSVAQIDFAPCPDSNNFACAHLSVPLDPSGVTPGSIALTIRRHLAPVGNAHSAVIALAGGPGQSAVPFASTFSAVLGPILSTRDLIVYDQRGTGKSHPLSCHSFEHAHAYHTASAAIRACAEQLGAERAFYTTPDSVADIEEIRQAGGYEKLVLYGTSYGTKVALEYAQRYPEHVEALVLDSVVPPEGPEPLERPTFAAIPRILRQLCAFHGCVHITSNPVADLAHLVRKMRRNGATIGRAINPYGHGHKVRVSPNDLLGILLEGDLDPILRAEFISAVRGADNGDNAPLARLMQQATSGEETEGDGDIDIPLYYATTCEEQVFPWSRSASPQQRLHQAIAQLQALPKNAFAPFTASNALALSDIGACAFWPFATPAPPSEPPALPNVPTLILSGADDLRTPTSGARAVAARIPDAHVVVVPNTGHSVLTTEQTSCARQALLAQFAGKTIAPCPQAPTIPLLRPTPLAPDHLSVVTPARGYSGRPGRTLHAIKLTIDDFARQIVLRILESVSSSSALNASALRTGGLRAGWAQLSSAGLSFHNYTYVPGVSISGSVKAESATLRIGGSAAARGTLRLGRHHELVGALGGRRVHIARSGAASGPATIVAGAADTAESALSASLLPTTVVRLRHALDTSALGFQEVAAALPQLWAARAAAAL